ncbi:MAG: hypothetical protein ACLGID_05705 [Gammaproteobacteria bacterium]
MARKATTPEIQPMPEISQEAYQEEAGALLQLGKIAQDMNDERDLLNQLLGQAQMAESFAKFSLTVSTSKLAFVKENKLYRALQGKRTADGQQFSGTWDDFCSLLGRSRQQVDEDIANLRCLGEDALESMSRMGIGYREMRQYRRLPEDQQAALIEVAKTGDKEAFIDLAEEIIAKHAAEKAELNKKLENTQADYQALDKLAADTSAEKKALKLELERNQLRTLPWDERIAPLKEEITQRQCLIDEALARHLQATDALDAWLTKELTSSPDYDPEAPVTLPPEAVTVLMHLEDAIQRTAHLVAGALNDLQNRFGADLAQARQHLLQVGE